jgi:catechol 2,3-dioxygenase-like lactoylglutathione lyase family enzyme
VARLYVNAAERPTLIVNDLKQPVSSGAIALWVGQGTIAHFADLRITKALRESASGSSANAHLTPDRAPDVGHAPKLVNTCLITKNVKRLVEFYERILELKANKSGEDYAEFPTDVGVLAIFSANAQEKYIPSSAEVTANRSVISEFRVADVDQQYRFAPGGLVTRFWTSREYRRHSPATGSGLLPEVASSLAPPFPIDKRGQQPQALIQIRPNTPTTVRNDTSPILG